MDRIQNDGWITWTSIDWKRNSSQKGAGPRLLCVTVGIFFNGILISDLLWCYYRTIPYDSLLIWEDFTQRHCEVCLLRLETPEHGGMNDVCYSVDLQIKKLTNDPGLLCLMVSGRSSSPIGCKPVPVQSLIDALTILESLTNKK